MPRDYKVSLDDILEAVHRIMIYTSGMERAQFEGDLKTVDAVVRNHEIIGEAAKNIPPEVWRDQDQPPIALALAAVLVLTIAMLAGGTKPERPLMSFRVIDTTQVQRTAAFLVHPVFGCLPGRFLYGRLT